LHVVIVGGAGAGKSTVANMLTGTVVAEANPQAGFTRHPIAYMSANSSAAWMGHAGFMGPLQKLSEPAPSSLDADVYQVRRVEIDSMGAALFREFVVWDCPDMTTWATWAPQGYAPRLFEVGALADVIVYVASDERYNDEIPTQFLQVLLQTGKPVVVCLMKMKESEAATVLDLFRREVASRLPAGIVSCLAIPALEPAELAEPARLRWRIELLNQVAVLGAVPAEARRRAVGGAMNYLVSAEERLLAAAREDLAALQGWRDAVQRGQVEFDERYFNEYLSGAHFHRFDEALVRLLDLLELPGIGRVISSALWVLRTPYRLARGLVNKALSRPTSASVPEEQALREGLSAWLDMLRREALQRGPSHPLWAHIQKGFETGLVDFAKERFELGFRGFQTGLVNEVDRTARAIFEELQQKPMLLNTLRGTKLTLDSAGIAAAVATGGLAHWQVDLVLVPLAASVTQALVEGLGKQYVETQRGQARQRQRLLMAQHISIPLSEWLCQWPVSGGSSFERLQIVLRRIPTSVKLLEEAVRAGAT